MEAARPCTLLGQLLRAKQLSLCISARQAPLRLRRVAYAGRMGSSFMHTDGYLVGVGFWLRLCFHGALVA